MYKEITQGVKAMATSSAERVRVFKEFGMPKYYQEAQPSYLMRFRRYRDLSARSPDYAQHEKMAGTAPHSISK